MTPVADRAPVLRTRTGSEAETRALAADLAALLEPGDLVVLVGGLGAGKTAFARGVGSGLGVDEPVVSPTFTIARTYDGRVPLHHLDLYRLDQVQEVLDLALEETETEGVTLVEWGDVAGAALPAERLEVALALTDDADDARDLVLTLLGPRWLDRREQLAALVAAHGGGA